MWIIPRASQNTIAVTLLLTSPTWPSSVPMRPQPHWVNYFFSIDIDCAQFPFNLSSLSLLGLMIFFASNELSKLNEAACSNFDGNQLNELLTEPCWFSSWKADKSKSHKLIGRPSYYLRGWVGESLTFEFSCPSTWKTTRNMKQVATKYFPLLLTF